MRPRAADHRARAVAVAAGLESIPRVDAAPSVTARHQQALLGPNGCLTSALAEGDAVALRVSGVCMEPDLRSEALVRVERCRLFWPGDVVAFHCAPTRTAC